MRATLIAVAAAAAALASPLLSAKEHLVEIAWSETGEYRSDIRVAARKFKELCVPLKKGARVEWSFSAQADASFNIHYHVGDDVSYPAKVESIRSGRGTLEVTADQHYCWLWKAGADPIELTTHLKLQPPARK